MPAAAIGASADARDARVQPIRQLALDLAARLSPHRIAASSNAGFKNVTQNLLKIHNDAEYMLKRCSPGSLAITGEKSSGGFS
jgi:hypothetical protein